LLGVLDSRMGHNFRKRDQASWTSSGEVFKSDSWYEIPHICRRTRCPNVIPVWLRIQYLCTLEFTRISCKSVTSKIHSLLLQAQACQSGITPSTTSSFSPNPLVTRWKTCLWNSNTLYNRQIYLIVQSTFRLVAWHSGRTSVSGWRTFLVLRSTCTDGWQDALPAAQPLKAIAYTLVVKRKFPPTCLQKADPI